jgi:hypothetical protein
MSVKHDTHTKQDKLEPQMVVLPQPPMVSQNESRSKRPPRHFPMASVLPVKRMRGSYILLGSGPRRGSKTWFRGSI